MLRVYWKLDGNTLDTTPTGPDGFLEGVANWVSGRTGIAGTALKFDGTTNYIHAGSSLNLTGQFSILMWVKVGILTTGRALLSKGESVLDRNQNYGLMLTSNNNIVFPTGDGVDYRTFITSGNLPDSNWHHVAAVYVSATEMNVYIDGILQQGTYYGSSTRPLGNTQQTIIGASSSTTELFDGTLQEIKIYDEALTSAQVTAEYGGCPPLNASIIVTETENGFSFVSTAIGGVPTNDGFQHEIFVDNSIVYTSGLGEGYSVAGTITTTPGTHVVYARISDGCIPRHQVVTSEQVTISVGACLPSECMFNIAE